MAEILIKVDQEKKNIEDIKLPTEINPVDICIIMNTVQNKVLASLTVESKKKVEIAKPKIIGA